MNTLVSLRDVSVALGATHALRNISLAVAHGDIVALLGPNGAGKTTLLRAVLGLIPVQGDVRLGDCDPTKLSPRQRALRAAYLPQRPQSIWPVSVKALVALGRFAYGAAPDRLGARDQAAVDEAIEVCGLGPLRRRRMDEISGGEKARAHLARALAQQTPLLLLDEPTAGLDPAQSLAVAHIIRRRAESGAVVFATHDITLAANTAHRVVLLQGGAIIADGAPFDVLTPEALLAAYGSAGGL